MKNRNIFKIIIIDDNESIHQDFIKILKTKSSSELENLNAELFGNDGMNSIVFPEFIIDTASQGQEGVELIKQALEKGEHYALAFVDVRMPPGWDGVETIKHIWELDKEIQVVICTAYSDYTWEETVSHLGKKDNLLILKKPFDNVSVRQLACALTTKWQLAEDSRQYTSRLQQQVAEKTSSLQKSLSLVKSTFESSTDGILVIDKEGKIIDYNQNMISMLKIPEFILKSKRKELLIDYLKTKMNDSTRLDEVFDESLFDLDEVSISVIQLNNGKVFECYSQPHKLENKIIGRILDFRDITKRAKLEKELHFQATHDELTGLANRVQLLHNIKLAIKTAELNQAQFAVAFIDFDRFKLINDSLSHQVGDELLKQASQRLNTLVRSDDTLARLGGDEFIIVFKNILNSKSIEKKLNDLIALFQKPFNLAGRDIILTASIGVSIYPKDGENADVLLRNADAAMYQAKFNKGNNYQFYSTEMSAKSLAVLDQEIELRRAVSGSQFFLCYQPQLDLHNEKLVAVEALLRWNHPTKGVLLPMDFVPLAEEIGLIVTIGEWALRTACQQNKAWQDKGLPPIRVAVNVSPQQFKTNLVETVRKILHETGLQPNYLELEMTENVILSNAEIIDTIMELKKLGVMIAIDDFGTGYSSLSYLHKLPFDRLKIDSSFVQHIKASTDDEVIIRAIIAMAKNLNLEVLAEGVETRDQLNFLKKNDCIDVQGFYFSKPLTTVEVESCLIDPSKLKRISETKSES